MNDIRVLSPNDLPACLALAQDRAWAPEGTKWRLVSAVGRLYGIDAPDGDGLAAVVASTPYGKAISAIGMMLVARRYERQGLGRRLMQHAIADSGTETIWLTATALGQPLYDALGFRAIGEVTSWSGTPPLAAGGRSRPARADDLPSILRLDQAASGAPRERLLQALGTYAGPLRVIDGADGVAGFCGGWRDTGRIALGPLVAGDAETAVALLADMAAGAGMLRLDIDHRQTALVAWARANGMVPNFTVTIMVHGAAPGGDDTLRFLPAALALG